MKEKLEKYFGEFQKSEVSDRMWNVMNYTKAVAEFREYLYDFDESYGNKLDDNDRCRLKEVNIDSENLFYDIYFPQEDEIVYKNIKEGYETMIEFCDTCDELLSKIWDNPRYKH